MTWALARAVGPWAAIALLAAIVLFQHDRLVAWRLKDKDQQAVAYNLRRDIQARDERIATAAAAEAGDRGDSDKACAADITTSFQKGVTYGRAIANAPKSASPGLAAGRQPGPGLVRDYRAIRADEAFRPSP